ncbi:MAG: hypothetical protein CO106_01670 [Deltaproteobacteria bacterium CG_4_9_14_3_um_filter_44_9]|nr:MAG: hypothetical protein COS67_11245 [Deltaproteobacteria bacterium CG06_land_8_20_14_3_00_44_19]PIX22879.1 MAG: hypothetical protein COZ68_11000 [Deltaproteobacteria bacterium CG_4_8_14_3_um_filter_43_13]PIZ18410.1 MAG: hypothetical protein COY50_15450 [Deltaproteobacteria bacterium CG_4_10_14_0_8_um_filter_43_12]PJB45476.1 MAG: hypothetical protein CO106_01670 [Deltaproteobacteria bacterium CG_4_9_14_3_um_filter_44_9]HCX89568.1 hypothetical protein [Deltaproteobacteria bacterium]
MQSPPGPAPGLVPPILPAPLPLPPLLPLPVPVPPPPGGHVPSPLGIFYPSSSKYSVEFIDLSLGSRK